MAGNGTKFSAEDLALLARILSPDMMALIRAQQSGVLTLAAIPGNVKPGDLITADFMNQILLHLANLETRVSDLETGISTLRIFRIDGPQPIRVGSRVTVAGENFSVPGSRNSVSVNAKPATPIDNASTDKKLVFDMPDPGIGNTGRSVMLNVMNADGQSALLQFQLEPALIIPIGSLAVKYVTPPAGSKITSGNYDFGFKLIADVDQDSQVQLSAMSTESGWISALIDSQTGNAITQPIKLLRASGTHFEQDFIVRVTVPGTGTTASVISIGATEITAGTRVNPALYQTLPLKINQPVPVPEERVAVALLGTSTNVTYRGGTAVFQQNKMGQIDFEIVLSNLRTDVAATTNFDLHVFLEGFGASAWRLGDLSQSGLQIAGPKGKGNTSITLTPPSAASNAVLLFTISGTPSVGLPVNVTYRIPLQST